MTGKCELAGVPGWKVDRMRSYDVTS